MYHSGFVLRAVKLNREETNVKMGKQRIVYLDVVKLFTMYLVILGHTIQMMKNGWGVDKHVWPMIYSFHVPLFMLLSGYFASSKSGETPFLPFVAKKAKQLLLPAVTCTLICCIYLFFTKAHPGCRDEIVGNSWFLKTLFVYYVIFTLLKRLPFDDWTLCVVSCAALFVIPGCSSLQVNLLFPYFWGGYMLKKYNVFEQADSTWKLAMVFAVLFVVLYGLQVYWEIPNYIEINYTSLQTSGHLILYRYMVGFSGSMATIFVIASIIKYCGNNISNHSITKYGQWTLGIYVLQTIIVVNIFPNFAWYVESEFVLDVLIAPWLALGFLVICIYLIHILSKNKILDFFFFGGQYYRM